MVCRISALAQEKPVVDSIAPVTDSTMQIDSLLKDLRSMLDSLDYDKSFLAMNINVSNGLFSLRNNNFNSQQAVMNKFSLVPAVSYNHKSGLGITGAAYMIFDSAKSGFYQYALSPSYDYVKGKKVSFGVSYTHYFVSDGYEDYSTPFANEFYGYIHGRKGWLRPGASLGWAMGNYKDVYIKDTVILGIPRRIIDTTHTSISDLSITASLAHEFEWDGVLAKDDDLTITPILYVVAGAQQYNVVSKYKLVWLASAGRLARKFKRTSVQNTGLEFQSFAFSLSLDYDIGAFSFSPQYYVSYYLPTTTANRWSNIFGLSIGFIF